jgi:hypothetical protein
MFDLLHESKALSIFIMLKMSTDLDLHGLVLNLLGNFWPVSEECRSTKLYESWSWSTLKCVLM